MASTTAPANRAGSSCPSSCSEETRKTVSIRRSRTPSPGAATVEGSENHLCDLRDNRVAESPESVHPSGYPMSHSTHVGFNCPPT